MKNYLFAKFFQHLSAEELMKTCRELGIDGPTALIRDGYWTQADNLKETLPAFVRLAHEWGLQVEYADTPFHMDFLDKLDDELALMAESGIRMFRINYIGKNAMPARELADHLARQTEKAAAAAERHGLRAIVQLHGGMYPHNATAAWPAIRDLDPRYIGIKIDPGNNLAQEGYELFAYQIELLGEYLAAVGEKDAELMRAAPSSTGNKGWQRRFAPAQQGIADYDHIFHEIKKQNLQPVGILMPFYYENDFSRLVENLREEVAYFRRCQREAGMA